MLRPVLRVASSKGRHLRHHRSLLGSLRCFAHGGKDGDYGKDGGERARTQKEVYDMLFSGGDDAGDSQESSQGTSSTGYGRFGANQETTSSPSEEHEEETTTLDVDQLPVRLWSDAWEITEDEYNSKMTVDDIPEWSPDFVSRISQDRVQLLEDGIPTLSALSSLPLPPPPFPHPGHGTSKEYAVSRRKAHQEYILEQVAQLAEPKIARILTLPTWQEKQDAVDELFESVELELRGAEPILQGHPKFGDWVERALEKHLKVIARSEKEDVGGNSASFNNRTNTQGHPFTSGAQSQSRRVYVGNLSWDVRGQDLKDHMRQAGEVLHAEVICQSNGHSRGGGIVEFATPQEAQEAMTKLTDSELKGRMIFVREDRETMTFVREDRETSSGAAAQATNTSSSGVPYPTTQEDEKALPVFMDCYNADDPEDQMVPQILTPLKPHPNMGPGRMVEEWELSAHATTKRIMLRQSTRDIARAIEENERARVFVTGRRGCGKTATLATIVASARKSGQIVLYMPDGNRLHRHGYYIEPNPKLEGMFDLPLLSQEVCKELLSVHEADLQGMEIEQEVMEKHFTEIQLEGMAEYSGDKTSLVELLKAAQSDVATAAMSYFVAINHLIEQDEKPFLMVLDEFNCYFEPGHYFHMDFDNDVNDAIPYEQISLFKPALDAMAFSLEEDEDIPLKTPVAPKRGGIVVGISESCAIARTVTDSLTAYANRSAVGEKIVPLSIVDVPRFSELEVDHVIANFECIGIGNLRCDQGETVLNKEGINYLKMVSSKVGQNLIDVCCT